MNLVIEMLRRVAQIFVGIFIFDCPGLMKIRHGVFKCIADKFGKGNVFSQRISFYVPHGLDKAAINIGNNVRISENVSVDCSSPISIEDNVWISQNTIILNHEHVIDGRNFKESKNIKVTEGLTIKADAWIGANVVILPGVTEIGEGAIVGAGSVVTKNIKSYMIVAGNPAREIKERK